MTTGTRWATSLPSDDSAHAQAFLAEDERGGGHDEGGADGRRLEVDLGQRAGQQLAGAVVHVDLDQQGAAGRIDGVGGADQRALVGLAGVLGEGEADLRAALHVCRVELRQVGVDAQGLNGLHVKEFLARAGVDQLAGVDVARGDDAVEGRIDLFKGLQFAQPLDIGLGGADLRGGGRGLVHEGIGVLAGDGVGLDEAGVALGLDAGVVGVGLGGIQVGLGLGQLLVHFGRGDLGQQSALLHVRADVEVPVRQVAGGAGVDGRISEGGDVAGEHEVLNRRARFGRGDDHRGRGKLRGGVGEHFVCADAAQNAEACQAGEHDEDSATPTRALRGEMGSCSGAVSCWLAAGWFGWVGWS